MHPRLQGDPQQIFAFRHLDGEAIGIKSDAFAQNYGPLSDVRLAVTAGL